MSFLKRVMGHLDAGSLIHDLIKQDEKPGTWVGRQVKLFTPDKYDYIVTLGDGVFEAGLKAVMDGKGKNGILEILQSIAERAPEKVFDIRMATIDHWLEGDDPRAKTPEAEALADEGWHYVALGLTKVAQAYAQKAQA